MNTKSVTLFGLLASLLLIFFCIFFNAEQYYKELGLGFKGQNSSNSEIAIVDGNKQTHELTRRLTINNDRRGESTNDRVVETKKEDEVEAIKLEKKEGLSSFNYYAKNSRTFMSGKMPLLDNGDTFKGFIADCAKNRLCENSVTFFDYDETLSWKDLASSILTVFRKEKIVNQKLLIDKGNIQIEGEFSEQSGKNRLLALIEGYKSEFSISDMTTVKKELQKEIPIDRPLAKKLPQEKSKVEISTKNLKQEQEKISDLLKNRKINFKRNSGKLRAEGKKVLDKVVSLLKGKENILIDIQGHTDAGGKEEINLWISQVRADGVKKYLIKKGIKANSITAKGYGEKKLLLPKTPYDPSNRRVEIHLKRR